MSQRAEILALMSVLASSSGVHALECFGRGRRHGRCARCRHRWHCRCARHLRRLGADTYAVLLFNRTDAAADITVAFGDLGIASGNVIARELWQHADLGMLCGSFTANVPSHGVVMLNVTGA